MLQGTLARFQGLLGQWHGEVNRPGEPASRLEVDITELFGGALLQMESRGYLSDERYGYGSMALIAPAKPGHVICTQYSTSLGVVVLGADLQEDDTLVMAGTLPDGRGFHYTMAREADEIVVSSVISSDGVLPPMPQRIRARLQRYSAAGRLFMRGAKP